MSMGLCPTRFSLRAHGSPAKNLIYWKPIFIILVVLVIKRAQRVLPKLHAKRAIIRQLPWHMARHKKTERSSVFNLPKQRQLCPSFFFQFNMRISVIYGTLSVSWKRVVSVLSPLASNSREGSQILNWWWNIMGNSHLCRWNVYFFRSKWLYSSIHE